MHKQLFILFMLWCSWSCLRADEFSEIAEAHNMLDYRQLYLPTSYPVSLEIFGYVKAEGMIDSRQVFAARDGQLLYFPLPKKPDARGADINSRGDFDEFAIQTRVDLAGKGPEIGCFKTGFQIEADFFGRTDDTINAFELRDAYINLASEHIDILAGQTWHPICIPIEAPDTVSFNSGIPMNPYALCPQLRMTYHDERLEVLTAAIGYLGDRPFGPTVAGDKSFRDSLMPDFNVQARFKWDESNYIGIGTDIFRIVPRLETNKGFKETYGLTNVSAEIFCRFQHDDYIAYSKLLYTQNGSIWEMLGGYAVSRQNPVTDLRSYTPIQDIALWADFFKQGPVEPGLFIGYTKNLGSTKPIVRIPGENTIFSLIDTIDTVFRISPRLRLYFQSFIIGMELEYTRATYGTITSHAKVINTTPVANTRFLFATYYLF